MDGELLRPPNFCEHPRVRIRLAAMLTSLHDDDEVRIVLSAFHKRTSIVLVVLCPPVKP